MTLPTFNPDACCPQCAHDEASTRYTDRTDVACQSIYAPPAYDGARPVCHYYRGPHIHRGCQRCGFRWAEAAGAPSMSYSGRTDPS